VPADSAHDVPLGSANPTRAALGVDLEAEPVRAGPVPVGTVLWAEAYDGDWVATARGRELRHVESFGWANGYRLRTDARVSIGYSGQWQRWVFLAVALVIWLVVVLRLWKTRARHARRGRADVVHARRERRERSLEPEPSL